MKFLLVGDIHFRLNNPRSRNDDIKEVFVDKFNQINELCKQNNVDYVLCSGDVFDKSVCSIETLLFAEECINRLCVPIIAILGNHDLKGNVVAGYVLSSIHLLNRLCNNIIIKPYDSFMDIDNVRLYFNHYGNDNFMIDDIDNTKVNIIITHSSIVESEEFFECINVNEIATNADFIFTGHIHQKFNVDKVYNAGALIRITTGKGDMDREVEVGILDIVGKDIKLTRHNLNIKHYEEVFDIKTIKKKVEKLSESMIENINKSISSILSTSEIFKLVTEKESCDKEVLDYINKYIERN